MLRLTTGTLLSALFLTITGCDSSQTPRVEKKRVPERPSISESVHLTVHKNSSKTIYLYYGERFAGDWRTLPPRTLAIGASLRGELEDIRENYTGVGKSGPRVIVDTEQGVSPATVDQILANVMDAGIEDFEVSRGTAP